MNRLKRFELVSNKTGVRVVTKDVNKLSNIELSYGIYTLKEKGLKEPLTEKGE
ncbi:MAG: hypothetical protein MJH09_02090 [Cetobacterium sp.]|nr:hypothetical protein [Cetobacterium sp.]